MVIGALFFTAPEKKADIGTKQERYEKAQSFLESFGYSSKEIERILKQKKEIRL